MPAFLLKSSKTRKFVAEPWVARRHCAANTLHLIRLTADAAFRGGPSNNFFGQELPTTGDST
jgi:hypothetical protein